MTPSMVTRVVSFSKFISIHNSTKTNIFRKQLNVNTNSLLVYFGQQLNKENISAKFFNCLDLFGYTN